MAKKVDTFKDGEDAMTYYQMSQDGIVVSLQKIRTLILEAIMRSDNGEVIDALDRALLLVDAQLNK